ncbi:MAG: HD domain-containing protein [Eubacteriales bacterium]|nr:HD domain-containing protein [Eubacteriales bacterium]
MADDEVILIKLAERLHNMRTIEYIDERKKKEKAKETIEWFMPLARRLENRKLMDELSELSIRYC